MRGRCLSRLFIPALLETAVALASCGRVGFDRASTDAEPLGPDVAVGCERGADDATLALYTFDSDGVGRVADALGVHDGTVTGGVSYAAGPSEECGLAMVFDGSDGNYAVVEDAETWRLDEGSVDFWLRIDSLPDTFFGVISRDASGTDAHGHLTVFVDSDGRLVGRVQELGAESDLGATCSAAGALTVGEWSHVAINFGGQAPSELWLNGQLVDELGAGNGVSATCQSQVATAMDNVEPWVFGMTTYRSPSGEFAPIYGSFEGAIDSVRISSRRRDYSEPQYKP